MKSALNGCLHYIETQISHESINIQRKLQNNKKNPYKTVKNNTQQIKFRLSQQFNKENSLQI